MSKLASLITKLKIRLTEKTFYSGIHKINYLLDKNNSNTLIISFSAFSKENQKGQYNFIKTLNNISCNKLYILDNFGPNQRGSYYLGKDSDFFIESMVDELIQKIKLERNIKRFICLGSSKGGYAALYFGIKNNADYIISGAPQYLLGNYLTADKSLYDYLQYITGGVLQENIDFLNNYLNNMIQLHKNNKPSIYLHYSKNEHTYDEHIIFLIETLNKNGFSVSHNIESYQNHSEVSKYFPNYIVSTLNKIL